ncbi:diacylglycerol/lipid kinase family protein [Blastococcus xanthinilyticus]|uniref:Diacylglycerol kinase family enzyme n=1 Tax=Blastococcus xanthinilyticus TaxID=1564164 RepID=A0A5S5D718_9ACTN|nr:diacylglycerol kinase family protein [Blastococcus xanthinilyticus]TYP90429.1 diacylglycerol kinase family enzyme [Blastococcus xanthinilyticus]
MPDPTELLLVVNRSAGTAEDDAVDAAVDGLRAGADVAVAATGDAAELDEVLREHADRRVVVLGGDGSVHAVVAALDRLGRLDPDDPIGIIARGTGNDLARALGLPLDPSDGAAAVLAGLPRRLDLVRDDAGGIVVNAVHAGVGAEAAAEAVRLKGRLGAAAYPLGAALAGAGAGGWALRVEVDGRVVATEEWTADGAVPILMLGICNGPTIGGGTALAPGARPDDGELDVVVSTATGPVARVAYGAALASGRHLDRPDVLVVRGREVRLTGGPVAVDADGELDEVAVGRTWRVHPGAWSVLAPAAGRD